MNKFKKLAMTAVAGVMAGTMALSFTACGPDSGGGGGAGGAGGAGLAGSDYYGVINKEDGSLNYSVYKNRGNVTLNIAIGYKDKITSTSFQDIGNVITLPDGNQYSNNMMKPAWVQMGEDLNITWNDTWQGAGTGDNLTYLTGTKENGVYKYETTDIFTTDLTDAVSFVNSKTNILNLAKYLDRMPNFSKFLANNGVVYLSLLQDEMNTTTGDNQTIYIAPYFDGYNDIERYCIIRHDWAEKLLNGDTNTGATETFSSMCATTTSAEAFMGTKDYTVDAMTANGSATQKITKNYTAVKTAIGTSGSALNTAYTAIAGGAYNKDSGNIVDIMNEALKANANATGAQLVNLFRAYIDVAFTVNGSPAYSANNRANLFTGHDASWDVDDLVAMLRCVKTNQSVLVESGKTIGGITPRDGTNSRTPDLVSLACQLYGVRGASSRLEYTYIDNAGNLHDARTDEAFYDAMAKMNGLRKENLVVDYKDRAGFQTSSGLGHLKGGDKGKKEYFFTYDYSQSQTLAGFAIEQPSTAGALNGDLGDVPYDYYFAPIITPVSKWDVNDDKNISDNEYFRFTESWRSTKTSGLAVNGAVENDSKKLDAVLQFIDYLYSEDGQIVSTFGPMAENADSKGGFWYGEVQNNPETKEVDGKTVPKNYFTYKGTKYQGYNYKGKITPKLTDKVYSSFQGKEVNGQKLSGTAVADARLNFTNYARYLIGSTLPLGVKDQSFENQLTSVMGQAGANTVGDALAAGVIKGMSLEIDPNNYWFTCVPTGLPVSSTHQDVLDSTVQGPFKFLTGEQRPGGNSSFFSVMNYMILYGTKADYDYQSVAISYDSVKDLLGKKIGQSEFTVLQLATQRQNVYNAAWTQAKEYWAYLEPVLNGSSK